MNTVCITNNGNRRQAPCLSWLDAFVCPHSDQNLRQNIRDSGREYKERMPMKTPKFGTRFAAWSALLVVALIVAACGAPAASGPAGAPAEQATAAPAPTATPTPDADQAAQSAVVEGSQAAQSTEVKGVTVTSDEDVTTPRNHYGGEYHDVATSDAVNFHPYLTTRYRLQFLSGDGLFERPAPAGRKHAGIHPQHGGKLHHLRRWLDLHLLPAPGHEVERRRTDHGQRLPVDL